MPGGTASGPGERAAFPWAIVLLAAAAGALLRAPALAQDPWIDEVWSWGLARSRASAADVFTIQSSNSHALYTLWIRLLGDRPDFVLYRLPAYAAGVALIPLAARLAWRHGRAPAAAAAWLVALAYLPIVYSSEARGYAPMLLCALATHAGASAWIDSGRTRWLVLATAAAAAGVLFQSLYVLAWAAIALGVAARIRSEHPRRWPRLCAAFALPPLVLFAAWWQVNLRHVFNAGAPPWSALEVLTETASAAFGVPAAGAAALAATVVALAVLVADARTLAARRDPTWITSVAAVVLVPVATIAVLRDEFLAERYFLVPLVYWLLALARVLARVAERHSALALAQALALGLAFAAGNLLHLAPFLRVGRGTTGELVRSMAAHTAAQPIVVTGNYDFNVQALLEWHARSLPAGRAARYAPQRALPPGAADFFVVDEPRFTGDPPPDIALHGRHYRLLGASRHAGPSGSDWALYARDGY